MMAKGQKTDDLDVERIFNNIKNEMTNELTLEYLISL